MHCGHHELIGAVQAGRRDRPTTRIVPPGVPPATVASHNQAAVGTAANPDVPASRTPHACRWKQATNDVGAPAAMLED
jgi:hypothetical protein